MKKKIPKLSILIVRKQVCSHLGFFISLVILKANVQFSPLAIVKSRDVDNSISIMRVALSRKYKTRHLSRAKKKIFK